MSNPTDAAPSGGSAYELLTKPTLDLSDDEVTLLVADLRKRRLAYVQSNGKAKDTPAKAKAPPLTAEQKAANAAAVAAAMGLDFEL